MLFVCFVLISTSFSCTILLFVWFLLISTSISCTIQSTPTDGVNEGYQFDGTGAAMTDGVVNSAGLIYAYNENRTV